MRGEEGEGGGEQIKEKKRRKRKLTVIMSLL